MTYCTHIHSQANGTMDDIYIRDKPPKLGKSSCRKFSSLIIPNSLHTVTTSAVILCVYIKTLFHSMTDMNT